MKTAIYIEDSVTQLVLTPQNEWEKKITKSFSDGERTITIKRGSFYECRGGWVRFAERTDDELLILVTGIIPSGNPL